MSVGPGAWWARRREVEVRQSLVHQRENRFTSSPAHGGGQEEHRARSKSRPGVRSPRAWEESSIGADIPSPNDAVTQPARGGSTLFMRYAIR
jgi:hypothetical protein